MQSRAQAQVVTKLSILILTTSKITSPNTFSVIKKIQQSLGKMIEFECLTGDIISSVIHTVFESRICFDMYSFQIIKSKNLQYEQLLWPD